MRALLINPWIYDFAAYDLWARPLGLLEIASCLKQCGVELSLIDCLDRNHPFLKKYLKNKLPKNSVYGCGNYYSEEINKPPIFKAIPRRYKRYGWPIKLFEELVGVQRQPDIILVTSGMTYWYPGVFEAVRILKKKFSSVPLVLGGIYACLCPGHARKNSGADFVYSGNDIPEILRLIFRLTGYSYKKNKDDRLFYAYELYPKLQALTLRTSSGCPFKCSYCGWYLLEKDFVQFELDFIVKKIEYFFKARGIRNFAFYDDAFLYRAKEHALEIMRQLIKRKIQANFHVPNGLHIRYISPVVAKALKACGLIHLRLGLETTSAARQTKATNAEFLKAASYLKEAGYLGKDIGVSMMIGLPGQDFKEIEASIRFVARQQVRIYLEEYSPVPGTADFLKSGLTPDDDPLLHNNSAFPLYRADDYQKFQRLKDLAHEFNVGVTG